MNIRKPIFFWSDLHIGHENSIKFDNRPFKDLEHMHRVLLNNYNAIVPQNGICYFLGDIGFGDKEVTKQIISSMNGTKVCVVGNHDPGYNSLYHIGFDVVLHGIVMEIAGERVTLSHCPLKNVPREDTTNMKGSKPGENWHGESREAHKNLTFSNEGQYHLHGHTHSRKDKKECSRVRDGFQIDVGVCGNNYRPVSISEIESYISKHKQGKIR